MRGYLTKYDCSSADIAPLGSVSKTDAKAFLRWAATKWEMPILYDFLDAVPTAELLPLSAGVQEDEVEMGLTYDQLSAFGKLRKIEKLGPWSCLGCNYKRTNKHTNKHTNKCTNTRTKVN